MSLRGFRRGTPSLGALERRVLELLWSVGVADAQAVHAQLAADRSIALSTVQSTLERLVRKQLLERRKQGRAYHYRPRVSRQELTGRMVAELVGSLNSPAAAGFVDPGRTVDPATLDRLEAWIAAERRRGPGGGND